MASPPHFGEESPPPNDDQPGLLAANRWDGGSEFDDSKFCYVERIEA